MQIKAGAFFIVRNTDPPESKPCWQEKKNKEAFGGGTETDSNTLHIAAYQTTAARQTKKEAIFPKESDKTAGPLGTRVFTVRRKFCRYFLSPTKQITTKLVFVVSDHYGFVVISVFCRLYLQLTELRESRHEPLSTSLCLIEKIKKQMDGFRGPP